MATLFLLDTNILVHLVRGDATGEYLRAAYSPTMIEPRPLISIVTEGEVRSLTYQFRWGKSKVEQALFYLSYFKRVSIDQPEIYSAYAVIDTYSLGLGRTMGKNDLWIAATAHVMDAHILTTDRDFEHLSPRFLICERVESGGGAIEP
jgi:predicted nucleic acid-binding protein